MVLSYAVKGSEEGTLLQRMKPHFAYHSAKIVSYTAVGLLLGSIGNFISNGARSWVSVVAGFYMLLLGLQMTGRFPWLNRIQPKPPRFIMSSLMKLRRKATRDAAGGESTLATPLSFGLMTGFMPCGPLIAAQVAAAGSGSTVSGGLAMLGFGLGTAPIMLGYGAAASFLGASFKKYMAVAGAIVILVLGLVMINRGATALGSPVTFNTLKQAVLGTEPAALDESKFATGADGVVEVPLVIERNQFQPQTLAIPADKPVRLIVDRREDNLCSDQLFIPSLGIQAPLTPNGVTSIDVPATKSGSFQMTCQMGMMAGTLQVGTGAARSGVGAPPLTLLLFVLVGTLVWVRLRRQMARQAAEEAARAHRTKKHAPPVAAPGVLGFSHAELALGSAAALLAVFLGLLLGGYFA
jgi:sulfite exporter TauE/SafE